ncbi:MAG: hypothetical protein LBF93_08995, partial [Zoogloeaceae bacterium]|nr:hypothetical protein [Zoogloeaceae bacterium]
PSQPPAPAPQQPPPAAPVAPSVITRVTSWFSDLLGGSRHGELEIRGSGPAAREARGHGEHAGHGGERANDRRGGGNSRAQRGERDTGREHRAGKSDAPLEQGRQRPSRARGERGNGNAERQERPGALERGAEGESAKAGNRRRRSRDKTPEDDDKAVVVVPQAAAITEKPAARPRRASAEKPADNTAPAARTGAGAPDEQTAPADGEAASEKRRRRSRGTRRGHAAEGEGAPTEALENDTSARTIDSENAPAAVEQGAEPAPPRRKRLAAASASPLPVATGAPFDAAPLLDPASPDDALPVAAGEPFQPLPEPAPRQEKSAEATPVPLPLLTETDAFMEAPPSKVEAPVFTAPVVSNTETVQPGAAPATDLSSTLENAGLVMIETTTKKSDRFGNGAPEEPVRRGRKPRAAAAVREEPLQQVATHKDDA